MRRIGLTMHVREFSPMKESLRTCVSLLALNGVWGLFRPSALMHSWWTDEGREGGERERQRDRG